MKTQEKENSNESFIEDIVNEKLKNVKDKFKIVTLPLSKEELSEYIGKFNQFQFVINYEESLKNLGSNNKILIYISNCGIISPYLDNFKLDNDFEDLLLEYVKFDQEVTIPALSEIWVNVVDLHPSDNQYLEDHLKVFIEKFRNNHKDYVEEINTFFYSLSQALNNIIVPTDKELEDKILNAPKNKLKLCNINVISLVISTTFYPYITKITDCKLFMFEEFVTNVVDGMSVTRAFLSRDTPYRMMYMYNQVCLNLKDNDKEEALQEMLDRFNKEKGFDK